RAARAVVDVVDDPLKTVRTRPVVVRVPLQDEALVEELLLDVVGAGRWDRLLHSAVDDRGPDRHDSEERRREPREEVAGRGRELDRQGVAARRNPGDVGGVSPVERLRADDVADQPERGSRRTELRRQRALDRVLEGRGGYRLVRRR